VACPDTIPDGAVIALHAAATGAAVVVGPALDVLARYAKAAREVGADRVLRITSDCPLLSPAVCDQVLALHAKHPHAVVVNNSPRTYPWGYDCECATAALLFDADRGASDPADREHVFPYLKRANPVLNVSNPAGDQSHLHWTLDTPEDYERIWQVLKEQRKAA